LSLGEAIVKMTEYGYGCVTVLNQQGDVRGVFTDGDLRRKISGNGRESLGQSMAEFEYKMPITIDLEATLDDASKLFKNTNVDTILVTQAGKAVGMLDIQDLQM